MSAKIFKEASAMPPFPPSPVDKAIRLAASRLMRKWAPRYHWRRRFENRKASFPEPELHLVPFLCDRTKTSIDVGSHMGVYVAHMIDASRDCIAFEPHPLAAAQLTEMFGSLGYRVRVETVALSNSDGEARLQMLTRDQGRSTIEAKNLLEDPDGSDRAELVVQRRTLDSYNLDAVAFLKIDVEGHEYSVLQGASETIRLCQPIMLIEVEERHRRGSIENVTSFLRSFGYTGYFIQGDSLRPIDEFVVSELQNPKNIGSWKSGWARFGVYINNFFFVPPPKSSQFQGAFARVKANLR